MYVGDSQLLFESYKMSFRFRIKIILIIFFLINFINCLLSVNGDDDDEEDIKIDNQWKDLLNFYRNKSRENYDLLGDEPILNPNDDNIYENLNSKFLWKSLLTENGFEDDLIDEKNNGGGSSLAFVFDSTGSMRDELNQVKTGAKKILETIRNNTDNPIYNYIWVPFNDPGT